ncbi:MAG: homocysteine S-methyltransferase family protein [Oscillospiraceae bacterium]|nr:homocysteine S-methyltransferase family protein [Oscillospiraceae bacterium]
MKLADLLQGGPLLFDGGMGTMLSRHGVPADCDSGSANLRYPEIVADIHREYLAAGAKVISANTFQANELRLGDQTEAAVSAAIAAARSAGAEIVALDIGPTGELLAPMGKLSYDRAFQVFSRQVLAGSAAGVDLILIETFFDPEEIKAAIAAAKEHTELPVIATMTFGERGRTITGATPAQAVAALEAAGVEALGVNCSYGPDQLLPVVEQMLALTRLPLLVQPNAGLPVFRDGKAEYDLTPDQFAQKLAAMAEMGVSMLGGCCGTTPEHIAALSGRLKNK